MLEDLVLGLRIVAATLALYNLSWSFRGVHEVARGGLNPPAIYLSVVFWFSIAVLTFQAALLVGQSPMWRLLAYVLLSVGMGLAAGGHRLGSVLRARQFYGMYDHLDAALAITDLARVDATAAAAIAANCRQLTADVLAVRHG